MNNNLENFIDTEAKSVEQLRAEAAAAEAEVKELQAKLNALKGNKPKKPTKVNEAKLYATPQYDF